MYRHQMPTEKLRDVQRQLADEIDELETVIERKDNRITELEARVEELEAELLTEREGLWADA
jgi:predicted  nucleic acid-binding Zn-ribbon protein